MIKSLYVRIVLVFLASVIAGITVAIWVAFWALEDRLVQDMNNQTMSFSRDIARIYETLPFREADALVSGMKQRDYYRIRIYDDSGQIQSYGMSNGNKPSITPELIESVLGGEGVFLYPKNKSWWIVVGLPLRTGSGTKALFVQPIDRAADNLLVKVIVIIVAYSLTAGSVFILSAAIFLIRPLKKLTKATKRLAAGDFSVKLNINQKDELGTLARSFEEMTHDLHQVEQMRRDFVSNVSHEVQSPLTSISGYAKALKQVDIADNERNRYLDIIIAESERVSKMSDNLLKLAILEAQQHPLRAVGFRLDEQIRRVIVAGQPLWSVRNIQFEPDLPNVIITADQDQLNQVWTNLLGNSIKFSPDNGTIAVSIEQEAKHVIIRFTDNGIGISPEDQKRIFERFFKADRSHSRKYDGSGLGLAIVNQIVSLHQGHVRVESEAGRGTTFIVTLPITKTESYPVAD